mmetsp:Transcript_19521/g.50400  ORF Transcript_19521/g.50400 Transcript_19521/m.50400 type:complete len:277 (+) Transcript_19521:410-1240(+)
MFERSLSYVASDRGAMTTTGMNSSMSAIGPCFISAAAYLQPSAWRVSSWPSRMRVSQGGSRSAMLFSEAASSRRARVGAPFRVDVRDLLEFERPFERHWEAVPTSEVEEVVCVPVHARHLVDLVALREDVAHLLRQAEQLAHVLIVPLLRDLAAIPAELQREHREHGDLRRERLCRRDADLRAGMQVDAGVGLAGDGRADDVTDAEREKPLRPRILRRRERVRRLARLRDHEDHVLLHLAPRKDRLAITKLGRILHLDVDARELLDEVFAHERGVP